ncbi:helix-turn-helix domain-containing protein [Shimazuella alba]|uniref:Helix-turn-helix domain-containing protein n=1 Tax=Shimazuella alba TaxID=2690964 RepID=A0A6I4VS24_9BACL|nr:helix-turn-helix domain-containing protein [Shimazuella alba]
MFRQITLRRSVAGSYPIRDIAEMMEISRTTVYRYLAK